MPKINAQYNVAKPDSIPVKVATAVRRKMYGSFMGHMRPDQESTILDIGATSDRTFESSNYMEAWYPHKHNVTAVGIDDASWLETAYPGMRFLNADARDLPFQDGSFDFVHSSAVLEHVGSRPQQARMISEAVRVARRGVFLTTPNRWFPIEFHSVLPLLHWLPPNTFRAALRRLGQHELAREENLNLLGRGDLAELCEQTLGGDARWHIDSARLLGLPSNLLLIVRKDG